MVRALCRRRVRRCTLGVDNENLHLRKAELPSRSDASIVVHDLALHLGVDLVRGALELASCASILRQRAAAAKSRRIAARRSRRTST